MTMIATEVGTTDDHEYHAFLQRVNERFQANTCEGALNIFTTDAQLWSTYLLSFDLHTRQHHNCNACRRFIETYGGLVTIDPDGSVHSAIWNAEDAPEPYKDAVSSMARDVARAKVTGVFITAEPTWGQPVTGPWQHLHVKPAAAMLHKRRDKSAHKVMAEKREDFGMLQRALTDYSVETLMQAVTLLKSDALYRSEKVLGVAEWFLALKRAIRGASSPQRRTAGMWLSVASAPPGFAHVRSSMIGTLLDDIQSGLPFTDVSAKFAAKMHPLQYQRPQAAPKAGTLVQAEKLAEVLGIGRALERRYARLDDIQAIWRPVTEKPKAPAGGVFSSVKARDAAPVQPGMVMPPQVITFQKFRDTVLPGAQRIELQVPYGVAHFVAVTTAVHADAPPLLQWDREGARNPVSWYVYAGGSTAERWGLGAGRWLEVPALMLMPCHWADEAQFSHFAKRAVFVLPGSRDSNNLSAALFPETMRSELHPVHPVRSVIEAYAKANKLQGADEASANGIEAVGAIVRVTDSLGNPVAYKIDRWD